MRLLFCYYRHKPGGFCARLYRAMVALAERGHEVHYLSCAFPEWLDPRIHRHRLHAPHGTGILSWLVFLLCAWPQVLFFALWVKPERLIAFGPFYAVLLWPAAIVRSSPIILFVRSKLGVSLSRGAVFDRLFSLVDRLGVRAAQKVVVLTPSMRAQVLSHGVSRDRIEILPNDIPVRLPTSARRIPEAGPLVALAASKGIGASYLIRVFDLLARRGIRDWTLRLVGDGGALKGAALSGDLPSRGDACGAADVSLVTVEPWVENLSSRFEGVDLLLHPSPHEGMPNLVLEAMGAGLGVLCARTPELLDLMGDGELLFDLGNHAALADRLAAMALNRQELQRVGDMARLRANLYAFDWSGKLELIVAK